MLSLAAATSGHLTLAVAIVVSVVQAGLGLGLMFAYGRFLLQADELRRKVELEALAIGTGLAVAGGFPAAILSSAGVISAAAVIGFLAVPFLAYSVMVSHGMRRYA